MATSKNKSSYTKLFKWFDEEMTLKEIAAEFTDFLPFLVLIKEGSRSEKLSIKSGEIYWVHDVIKCQQVIVEDLTRKQMVIPECYSAQVIPTMPNGKVEAAFPFNQVRERGSFKYISFVEPMQKVRNEDSVAIYPLTNLQVIDTCDEDMLVVHRVFLENMIPHSKSRSTGRTGTEVLLPQFTLLPSYLPIRVSIALSLAEAPDVIYFHTMAEMKEIVETYPHDYDVAKKEAAEIITHHTENEYAELTTIPTSLKFPKSNRSGLVQRLEELKVFYLCGSSAKPVLKRPGGFHRVHSSPSLDTRQGREDDDQQDYLTLPSQQKSEKLYQCDTDEAPRATFSIGSEMPSSGLARNVASGGRKPSKAGSVQRTLASEMHRVSDSALNVRQQFRGPPQHRLITELKDKLVISRSSENLHRSNQQMSRPTSPAMPRCRARSLDNFAGDLADMSVDEVSDFLVKLHLGSYVSTMRKNQVDGRLLLCLKEETVKTEFGFSDQDAKRLMNFLSSSQRTRLNSFH